MFYWYVPPFFICGRSVFKLALGTDTFRIPQIIVNVSTAAIPLELQPPFYQYGVGSQFYHMSVFQLLYATCLAVDHTYNSFLLVKRISSPDAHLQYRFTSRLGCRSANLLDNPVRVYDYMLYVLGPLERSGQPLAYLWSDMEFRRCGEKKEERHRAERGRSRIGE